MLQFTSNIACDNASIHNNFVYSLLLGDKEKTRVTPNTSYHTTASEQANSFFRRDYNWEYFSNELEFE